MVGNDAVLVLAKLCNDAPKYHKAIYWCCNIQFKNVEVHHIGLLMLNIFQCLKLKWGGWWFINCQSTSFWATNYKLPLDSFSTWPSSLIPLFCTHAHTHTHAQSTLTLDLDLRTTLMVASSDLRIFTLPYVSCSLTAHSISSLDSQWVVEGWRHHQLLYLEPLYVCPCLEHI